MPLDVVQGSPPVSPNEGDVWVNTRNGRRYVWTPSSTGGGAWVHTPPVGAPPPSPIPLDAPVITNPVPKITMSNVPPLTPVAGDLWFDTVRGFLFVFYNDGNTTQWVVANPGRGGNEGPAGLPGTPSGPAGGDLDGFYPDPVIMDSVALTGAPTAPTPTANSNNQMLVTTNYIHDALAALPSVPTALPPNGPAGGDLTGGYPNPTIKSSVTLTGNPTTTTPTTADNTTKIPTTAWVKSQGYALNTSIPVTLPPSGPAGGALAGTYPNPGLAVPYPTTLPPNGPAGGDLQGTYPNPTIKSSAFPAPPSTLPPSGPAGGALSGTYPNPGLAVPYPTTLPPNGPAGGDLQGTYPNPTLKVSGTLANYLPLAGGTLTGALTGTTAVFSGNVQVDRLGVGGSTNPSAKLAVTDATVQTGFNYLATLTQWNSAAGATNTGLLIEQNAPNVINLEVGNQAGAKGTLNLQPFGGTVNIPTLTGTTATLSGTIPPTSNDTTVPTTAWVKANGGGSSGASVTVSDTAPGSPTSGALWWNSVLGVMFIWYVDPNTSQWVPVVPSGGNTPPNSIPQNSQAANYTLTSNDAGQHIYHPVAAAAATYTIPANATVPFVIGTTVSFVNDSANAVTLAITTDTLVLSPGTTTGSRTLATGGVATALKVTATRWIINGTGLT